MEKKKLQINISFIYKNFKFPKKLIQNIFSYILKKEKFFYNYIIDIAFVDNKEIKKLNLKYRKKNKPTDVLSFNMLDSDEAVPLLGEIVISVPYAKVQAKKRKHSLKNEILFLLIHGLLHLLGYSDETFKDYDIMMKKQSKYMGLASKLH